MNIIIAGAGKVGFNLAKTLSIGHNVVIIDKNEAALQRIQESLDIMPHKGDVEDPSTYKKLFQKEIDLFIAVTNIDNVNIVSTLIAQESLNIKRVVVRFQNAFFQQSHIAKRLNIDHSIFPINLTSKSIISLLNYPKANNVKSFLYSDFKLISVRASSRLVPKKISLTNLKIVGIERKKEFFIPHHDSVEILPNDLLYFFGDELHIRNICETINFEASKTMKRSIVYGAGELGIAIAKELLAHNQEVKVVDEDITLCHKADELLGGKATVINAKYHSHDIFEEEYLYEANIFIAATEDDEFNIIKSLEAKESGITKVVAINNELEYYNLMHALGIVVVRGPKINAYNTILEAIDSSSVVIQKSYCGAKATLFMRKVFYTSGLVGKKIKPINADATFLLIRNSQIIELTTKVVLEVDDTIVAFATSQASPKVKQWMYEL